MFTLLLLWSLGYSSLWIKKVAGVNVHVVPEVLLEAVVVVAVAAVLPAMTAWLLLLRVQVVSILTPSDSLLTYIQIYGASFVPDFHALKSGSKSFEGRKTGRDLKKSGIFFLVAVSFLLKCFRFGFCTKLNCRPEQKV